MKPLALPLHLLLSSSLSSKLLLPPLALPPHLLLPSSLPSGLLLPPLALPLRLLLPSSLPTSSPPKVALATPKLLATDLPHPLHSASGKLSLSWRKKLQHFGVWLL